MLRNVHLWLSCVVMLCCAVSCSAQHESADGPPSLTSSKSSSEAQQRPGAQAPAHEASKASSSKDEVGAEPSVERSPPARRDALEDSLEEVAAEREPLEDSAEEAAAEPESEAEPKRKKEAPIPALAPAPAPAEAPPPVDMTDRPRTGSTTGLPTKGFPI